MVAVTTTSRRHRLRALVAAAGITAAVGACDGDRDADAEPATSSAASEEATPACVAAQRRASRTILSGNLSVGMFDSPDRTSPDLRPRLERALGRAERAVSIPCGQVPGPLAEFAAAARGQLDSDQLGLRELDEVLDAAEPWVETIGTGVLVERERRYLDRCRHFADTVHATYRVVGIPDPAGKTWQVELVWDNGSGKRPYGQTGGTVAVTGFDGPDPYGWMSDSRAGTRTAGWGGSSADVLLSLRPGANRMLAAASPTGVTFHTTADGTVEVRELYMSVGGCSLVEEQRSP